MRWPSTCHQAGQQEFESQDPHDKRNELTAENCPLHTSWHHEMHTYVYINKFLNVKKAQCFFLFILFYFTIQFYKHNVLKKERDVRKDHRVRDMKA